MVGIRGAGEIRLMAAVAGRGQRCVVVVGVALRASHRGVGARQREGRGVVIEGGARPIRCGMACGARGGEAHRDVIGVRGPVVIGLVAGITIRRHCCVVVVRMATCARHSSVEAGQREHCRVIERRRGPVTGRVADRAIRREA